MCKRRKESGIKINNLSFKKETVCTFIYNLLNNNKCKNKTHNLIEYEYVYARRGKETKQKFQQFVDHMQNSFKGESKMRFQ